MELIEMKLENIHPYERNPRKNDGAVSSVAESIKQCGYVAPIIVDEDHVILAGHTRLKALKKLGYKTAPVVIKEGLTDEQKRKYRILDNKTGELAEWNFDLLAEELEGLDFGDLDMDWGLEEDLDVDEIVEETPPAVDEENDPVCRPGEIWKLGRHRLMCGDSTKTEDVENLMNGEKASLCITDPPYNVDYQGHTDEHLKILNDKQSIEDFKEFLKTAFEQMNKCLLGGGAYYIWHASRTQREFETALNEVGLQVRQQLIWVKNAMTLGRQDYQWRHEPCFYGWKEGAAHYFVDDRTQTTVFEEAKPIKNDVHPTMKPVKLIAKFVENSSKKDDIVLDLFGGSGSTLIASEQLRRKCYIMEFDPKFCDVIIRRWEKLTGEKAICLKK